MTHTIRFIRHTVSGEHCAICTCGWSMTGELATIQACAADHDLRRARPAIAEIVSFKSGLAGERAGS